MPGLTIETKAQARRPVQVTAVPVPIIPGGPAHGGARSASNPHPSSTAGSRAVSSRTSSPTRPPISPITPTLGPARLHGVAPPGTAAVPSATTISTTSATTPSPRTLPSYNSSNNATAIAAIPDFALGRPAFTISSQPDQTQNAIPHPPVQVIDFDSNPDVLAVRSAINILQLQRARAAADIQALHRAKEAALEDPEAFVADLASGRIGTEGDPLMNPHADRSDGSDSDDDDDEHEDEDDYEEDGDSDTEIKREEIDTKDHNGDIDMLSTEGSRRTKSKKSAWRKLPKPQTVVRCPPINWSQYAVAGESLDKLHAEQVAAPDPGAPSVLAPRGTYDFKQEERAGGEKPQKLVGIAAPYVPGRDKLGNGKGRGGKR